MSNPSLMATYSSPQNGGELPYFIGKQYGSGWLKTLGRFAIPILKRIGGVALRTAKDVIVDNKPLLQSLKTHALSEASDYLRNVTRGNGIKRRHKPSLMKVSSKKRKLSKNSKPKTKPKKKVSVKKSINKRRRRSIFKK